MRESESHVLARATVGGTATKDTNTSEGPEKLTEEQKEYLGRLCDSLAYFDGDRLCGDCLAASDATPA